MHTRAINFFSKLLNSTIDEDTLIKLSSGQSARAYAWLTANNVNFNALNLRNGFTIRNLIYFGEKIESSPLPKTAISALPSNYNSNPFDGNASIGVDIQSIAEMFPQGIPNDPKSDTELLTIYTLKELSYAQSKPDPLQTLTGLFAAKEAILKCSSKDANLNAIEISVDPDGRPSSPGFIVSISHSVDFAVAIAMSINSHKIQTALANTIYPPPSTAMLNENNKPKNKKIIHLLVPAIVMVLAAIELLRIFR